MFELFVIGVYMLVFPSGHFYIGSSWGKGGIGERWRKHKKGYKNSPKYLMEITNQQGGWENVKLFVLKMTKNMHSTQLWEQAYIHKYWKVDNKNPLLLNKRREILEPPNFKGENSSSKRSEVREKIRNTLILLGRMVGDLNPSKRPEIRKKISQKKIGTVVPVTTREKISIKHQGKVLSDDTKRKIGLASRGRKISEESKSIISKIHKGKVLSAETKEKISKSNMGKKRTEKMLIQIKIIRKGENNGMAIMNEQKVKEIKSKYKPKIFTVKMLAEEYGVSTSTIRSALENWKYLNDETTT